MSSSISSREVNAALRAHVWPALRERGFTTRTQRAAWSYRTHSIAVVNFQSFNSYVAESMDVTTFSFSVNLGIRALCSSDEQAHLPVKDGKLRPQESQCDVRRVLWKTIDQPESSRPDVWFLRPDGSNLLAAVEDARSVLLTAGMDWLDEFSNPERLLRFAENEPEEWDAGGTLLVGTWGPGQVGSPARRQLIDDLKDALKAAR
jgi:hypothetical protein